MSQMKLKVEFPTWETLTSDLKGLLSVYMDDATFRCVGNHLDDFTWSHLSGAIVSSSQISTNSRVKIYYTGYYEIWPDENHPSHGMSKLSIPYTEDGNPLFTDAFNGTYVSNTSTQYDVPDVCTVLCKANTQLKLYQCNGHAAADQPVSVGASAYSLSDIPCVITPFIDDVENTDSTLVPNDIKENIMDMSHIEGCRHQKITPGIDITNIITDANDYNFTLQTEPFLYSDTDDYLSSNYGVDNFKTAYYKGGVYCFDTPISIDSRVDSNFNKSNISNIKDFVINQIKNPDFKFRIYNIDLSCGNYMHQFGFTNISNDNTDFRVGLIKDIYYDEAVMPDDALPTFSTVYNDQSISSHSLPRILIVPIGLKYHWDESGTSHDNTSVVGFLYMKLYNVSDDSPITESTHSVQAIGKYIDGYASTVYSGHALELSFQDIEE